MKFFNKQRLQHINFKRLKKYLIYAVGEVVLVVIGILIAVSINNANEDKKTEKEIKKIAFQVEQKLENDIQSLKDIQSIMESELKLYNLYLKENKTEKETLFINAQTPFLVTTSIQFLTVNPIISSLSEKVSTNNSDLSNKLIEIEDTYKVVFKDLNPMEEILKEELIENLRYIKSNFEWYEKVVNMNATFTEEEQQYFNSIDYKNRVVHMKFLYIDGYSLLLQDFQLLLENHLIELKKLL